MKTGDLEPPWRVAISDSDETANLTGVSSWRFVARRGTTVVFTDTSPTVTVGANVWTATVKHTWVLGETTTAGLLEAEIVAVWPGGREQTFPSAGEPLPSILIAPGID